MTVPEKSEATVPETSEAVAAGETSKRAAINREVSLPPLSELRSQEEVREKPSTPSSAASDTSNIAYQLLKSKKKPEDELADERTGVKKLLDDNKNVVEYFKYNAKIILPSAAAVLVVCIGLYWLMSSMMGTVEHPPLEIVTGTVTLDGQPLSNAVVTFVPQDEWKPDELPAESIGKTNKEGKFELFYAEDLKGAALGNYFVRILSSEKVVPSKYNVRSELKYKVKQGTNDPEFKLLSK